MKKLYTTPQYIEKHKRKITRIRKKRQKEIIAENRAKRKGKINKRAKAYPIEDIKLPVIAPSDLRLIENTETCLDFFRKLRSEEYLSTKRNVKFVIVSLKNITQIDYGTVSILTAIGDYLKSKNIIFRGDFPENPECKRFVIESGFLSHMFDDKGKPFPKTEKSDLIFFEKGCGKLSLNDNMKISNTVKNVVQHLTGDYNQCLSVKTIVLEICGNSIEWGGTQNKQWLLGVRYQQDKVIFTVTDVGKGILETLHRKYSLKLADIFTRKSDSEILRGAFDQKYGSSTKEINRNKGLPSVKHNFEQNVILNLKVICNNVILHFDNEHLSETFEKGKPRFRGTFYQWEMTKDCIKNISTN